MWKNNKKKQNKTKQTKQNKNKKTKQKKLNTDQHCVFIACRLQVAVGLE